MFVGAQKFQQEAKKSTEEYYMSLVKEKIQLQYEQLQRCIEDNAFLLISTTSVARITNMLINLYNNVIVFDVQDLENQIYIYQEQNDGKSENGQTILLHNFFYSEDNEAIKLILQNYKLPKIIIVSSILQEHFNQLVLINLIKYYGSVQLIPKYYTSNQTINIDELQEKKILLNLCVKKKYPLYLKPERITCFLTSYHGKIWESIQQQVIKSSNKSSKTQTTQQDSQNSEYSSADSFIDNTTQQETVETIKQYFSFLKILDNVISQLDDSDIQKDVVWCMYNLMTDVIQVSQIDFAIKVYNNQDLNKIYNAFVHTLKVTEFSQQVQQYKTVNTANNFIYQLLVQYLQQLFQIIKDIFKENFTTIYQLVEKSTFLDPSISSVYDQCINRVIIQQEQTGYISTLYNVVRHQKEQSEQLHISIAFRLFCREVLKRKNIDYETILTYFKGSLNLLLQNEMLVMNKQYLFAVV